MVSRPLPAPSRATTTHDATRAPVRLIIVHRSSPSWHVCDVAFARCVFAEDSRRLRPPIRIDMTRRAVPIAPE